jgi:hypothetical protein
MDDQPLIPLTIKRPQPVRSATLARRSYRIFPMARTLFSSVPAWKTPNANPPWRPGFRGGSYISAEPSARGEWKSGGSNLLGRDAYATSKQCNLATVFACLAYKVGAFADYKTNSLG